MKVTNAPNNAKVKVSKSKMQFKIGIYFEACGKKSVSTALRFKILKAGMKVRILL